MAAYRRSVCRNQSGAVEAGAVLLFSVGTAARVTRRIVVADPGSPRSKARERAAGGAGLLGTAEPSVSRARPPACSDRVPCQLSAGVAE